MTIRGDSKNSCEGLLTLGGSPHLPGVVDTCGGAGSQHLRGVVDTCGVSGLLRG